MIRFRYGRALALALVLVPPAGGIRSAAAGLSPDPIVDVPGAPAFQRNVGQVDGDARFYSIGDGTAVYFEPDAVLLDRMPARPSDRGVALRLRFPAAVEAPRLSARHAVDEGLPGDRRAAPSFAEVAYEGIAPGADLVYRMHDGRLKYDLVLAPGADLERAVLRYEGATGLSIGPDGSLIVHTPAGDLREDPVLMYQDVAGARRIVRGGYRIVSREEFGFRADDHDPTATLVVDPGISWSTFVGGGANDYPYRVAADANGFIYVAGYTESADYPVTPGAYRTTKAASRDVFVTKLRGDGASVVWSTFIGGSGSDHGLALAVTPAGDVFVAGTTSSTDFPTTSGAIRTTFGGGADAFVARFTTDGALVYSTYLGGIGSDTVYGIAVDAGGSATVAGNTGSPDFPTTPGAIKRLLGDANEGFVAKLNPTGTALVYSTLFGTDGGADQVFGVALDSRGRATITGRTDSPSFPVTAGSFDTSYGAFWDGFVARLNETGTGVVYSSYLSGAGYDEPWAVAVDAQDHAYVVGRTASPDFLTTAGALQRTKGGGTYDGFVAKVGPDGRSLVFSTFLGSGADEYVYGIALDAGGDAYLTGYTESSGFPITPDAVDGTSNGAADAFVSRLAADGRSLVFSTYLGGSGLDYGRGLALVPGGRVVVSGFTASPAFPVTPGSFDVSLSGGGATYDGFVAALQAGSAGNVAVGDPHPPVPGDLVAPYPNPFRDRATFGLVLQARDDLSVRILDVRGRVVRSVAAGSFAAGTHLWSWDGRDDRGTDAGTGVFFVDISGADLRKGSRILRLR